MDERVVGLEEPFGQVPSSHDRVVVEIRVRVHSTAARASGLNHSISDPPIAAASWFPGRHRPELGQAVDDAVRIGPVADHVPQLPDGVDRTEMGEHGIEGDEIAVDVRKDSDPHRGEG